MEIIGHRDYQQRHYGRGIPVSGRGGDVAVAMCIIAIMRDITSSIIDKNRSPEDKKIITKMDWYLLALWVGLLTIATALTATGFATLFAYFATLTFTISIWQKNGFIYRLLGIFVGVFWIIYNIVVESFMGMTLESALLLFVIIGFASYIKSNKKLNCQS